MAELTELGLSSYEAGAYRALLSLGPATASEVADASEVPRGRIYDVLNGLVARDVVRKRSGSGPRRYEPLDPDDAVDRLLAERKRELDRERERYEELAAAVSDELSRTVPLRGQFWEIGLGTRDAVAGMREQFDRAEESLLSVVGPPYDGAQVDAYRAEAEAYADLVDADLEVKLLVTPGLLEDSYSPEVADALSSAPRFDVRATPDVRLTYDVIDGEAVYLTVPAPFEDGERIGSAVVRDPDLTESMAARFRANWGDARPVDPATLADD